VPLPAKFAPTASIQSALAHFAPAPPRPPAPGRRKPGLSGVLQYEVHIMTDPTHPTDTSASQQPSGGGHQAAGELR